MPLVWGKGHRSGGSHAVGARMVGGNVPHRSSLRHCPTRMHLDDPWLDEIPVWPDGNWRDDPTAAAQATITRQDFSPQIRGCAGTIRGRRRLLQRRYLASSPMKSRSGGAVVAQTKAVWKPSGCPMAWPDPVGEASKPIPGMASCAWMAKTSRAFWILASPAACLIVHPDGYRQYALTATCHLDQAVCWCCARVDDWVPAGSRVIRLVRCRLDHDAIDLYWHSPTLLEITLTARQLPEPRGNDRQTYEGSKHDEPEPIAGSRAIRLRQQQRAVLSDAARIRC